MDCPFSILFVFQLSVGERINIVIIEFVDLIRVFDFSKIQIFGSLKLGDTFINSKFQPLYAFREQ